MRSVLALGASVLAGLAAVVASLDGDADIVPFFVGLTFLGGLEGWAAHPPFAGPRRMLARGVSLLWLGRRTLDRRPPAHVHHGVAGVVVSTARPGSDVPGLDRDDLPPAWALRWARPFDRECRRSGWVVCR